MNLFDISSKDTSISIIILLGISHALYSSERSFSSSSSYPAAAVAQSIRNPTLTSEGNLFPKVTFKDMLCIFCQHNIPEDGRNLTVLECGHYSHADCFLESILQNKSLLKLACCMCKKPLSTKCIQSLAAYIKEREKATIAMIIDGRLTVTNERGRQLGWIPSEPVRAIAAVDSAPAPQRDTEVSLQRSQELERQLLSFFVFVANIGLFKYLWESKKIKSPSALLSTVILLVQLSSEISRFKLNPTKKKWITYGAALSTFFVGIHMFR